MLETFFKGLLIGFSISMPVGPIGLLCIRNGLKYGIICGMVTGLGAACADVIYGALAGLGISTVNSFVETYSSLFQFGGALFLCALGVKTFIAKSTSDLAATQTRQTLIRTFITTLLLTLSNPLTVLSFVGIYAAVGIGHEHAPAYEALIVTGGVFCGSALWWLFLSITTAYLREKVTPSISLWLNRLSGSLIFGCGAAILVI